MESDFSSQFINKITRNYLDSLKPVKPAKREIPIHKVAELQARIDAGEEVDLEAEKTDGMVKVYTGETAGWSAQTWIGVSTSS